MYKHKNKLPKEGQDEEAGDFDFPVVRGKLGNFMTVSWSLVEELPRNFDLAFSCATK
jgi:hypothetical protein